MGRNFWFPKKNHDVRHYCSSTALPILYVVKRAVTEALEGILLIRENQGKL